MPRRDYSGNAVPTTISSGIGPTSLTINIASSAGWPSGGANGKFFVTIDRGLSTEERVLVTSRTGTALTIASTADRGVDDTTATDHSANAVIEHTFSAIDADESNAHINDTTRDDHSQYLENTRHDIEGRHQFGAALGIPGPPSAIGTVAAAGSGDDAAREDHVHVIGTGAINNSSMFAAGVVDGTAIGDDAVGPDELAADSVTAPAIAAEAVGTPELGPDAVDGTKIADDAVGQEHIAATAVGAPELADSAVTTPKIAADSVNASKHHPTNNLPHSTCAQVNGNGSEITSLAAYVPLSNGGGVNLQVAGFVKHRADTKLVVDVGSGVYNDVNLGIIRVGVRIGTTDYDVFGSVGSTMGSGSIQIPGLSADTYTIQVRVRVVNSTGTAVQLQVPQTLKVTETF